MAPYRCAAVHVPVPQHPHRHVADATTTTTTTTTAAAAAAAAAAVPPIPPIPCRGCRGCRAASVPSSLRCHHHRCRATIEPQLQQRSRATELSPKSPPHTPRAFMHAASFHLSCVHHRAAAVHLPVTNAVRSISLLIFTRSAMGAEGKDIDARPEAIRRCRHDATFSHTLLTSKKTVALNDAFESAVSPFALTGFRKHSNPSSKPRSQTLYLLVIGNGKPTLYRLTDEPLLTPNTMASLVSNSPPTMTTLLVRERGGLVVYRGPSSATPDDDKSGTTTATPTEVPQVTGTSVRFAPVYSPDGAYLALATEASGGVVVHCTQSGDLVCRVACSEVLAVEFSPQATFLLTWSRPVPANIAANSGSGNGSVPNLVVWEAATGQQKASFFQKTFKRDALLQFTVDERLCFRSVNNEVHVLNPSDFSSGIVGKIHHKGVSQFRVSPVAVGGSVVVAVFNAEAGGNPARATLYLYALATGAVDGPVASRTMFSASEANMMFNSTGSAVLVHTQADVDHSNSSYYGASGLFLLTSDGAIAAPVAQSKEGPIHDVKWSPLGDRYAASHHENSEDPSICQFFLPRFVVCAGTMPCHTTLYNAKGESLYQFGAAHRNTVSWSPHGRFLALAGFGNLAGDMDFFDTVRLRKTGSNNAHCSVTHGWSPCSRYFMTATLAPRMNVDNGFKIFKYNGAGPVVHVRIEQAFDALWQPAAAGVYPARGPSPRRGAGADDSASEAVITKPAAATAPAPYRPPGSSGSLAQMMRRGTDPASAAGKVKPASGNSSACSAHPSKQAVNVRVVPGMSAAQIAAAEEAGWLSVMLLSTSLINTCFTSCSESRCKKGS